MRSRAILAALLAGASSLLACEPAPEPEPDFEWSGEWLDILGFGSAPEQTCAGTFEVLDDFAGASAQEFGVAGRLGVYRWYSPAEFAADDPCNSASAGCTGSNGVFTEIMPFEHEVVHLVNNRVVACPSVIAEGLAEYYGTTSRTPDAWDVLPLIRQSEQGPIALADWTLAQVRVLEPGTYPVGPGPRGVRLNPNPARLSRCAWRSSASSITKTRSPRAARPRGHTGERLAAWFGAKRGSINSPK